MDAETPAFAGTGKFSMTRARPDRPVPILPRQGEVAPKATEGEESDAPRKNAEDIMPAGNLWRN